jgi:hypothetical protein
MSTILITGGTGLIGTALRALLTENGYRVIILSRTPATAGRKSLPRPPPPTNGTHLPAPSTPTPSARPTISSTSPGRAWQMPAGPKKEKK